MPCADDTCLSETLINTNESSASEGKVITLKGLIFANFAKFRENLSPRNFWLQLIREN